MNCWRIDLRRDFSRYLDKELPARAVKRLEDHLLDCGECRTRMARMQTGHRLARRMPRFLPERDPWLAIEAAIEREQNSTARSPIRQPRLKHDWRRLVTPKLAGAVSAMAFLVVIAFVLIKPSGSSDRTEPPIDREGFHEVNIADIEHNTEPHVVAEGYVAEVRIDDEDGDLTFKLVESLHRAEPFIVCEIIDPIKLIPPPVGSRVRVYGVSRYDGKTDHRWYEVHPVLSIEVVKN
jgi:anti-sigma factor RsiW